MKYTSFVFGLSCALVACEQSSSTAAPAASAEPPAPAESSRAPKPVATTATPKFKEFTATADDALGKLPDGVGVAVGEAAPDAKLQDSEGKEVNLKALYDEGPTLILFYRGGWCPYCNFQIRSLTKSADDFSKHGVTPVAISVDQQDQAAKSKATWKIPFPTLSDPELKAHDAFRAIQKIDDAMFEKLKSRGMDLEAYSGKDHHTVAVPAIFLVVEEKVRWAHADRDYKTRPTTEQLLKMIATELGDEKAAGAEKN